MISKNDELTVNIINMTLDGNGIAKPDGYTLFIPHTVTGDTVHVKVTKTGKSYGFAALLDIVSPSKFRILPECPVFSSCGGCSLMHINYDYQLRLKKDFVTDCIKRIGGFCDAEICDVKPALSRTRYRNKIQLPVTYIKNCAVAGFYSPKSHKVTPTDNCFLHSENIKPIINTILRFMENNHITAYNEENHTGIVRHIFIREGFNSGEIMVSLIINAKSLPHAALLINLLSENKHITSVMLNINTKKSNVILGTQNIVLYGKDYIFDRLGDLTFKISHNSFYQVNPAMTLPLYKKAIELLGDMSDSTVFDLYCGIGTISLFAAKKAKKVIGIEYIEDAVKNARENAEINGIVNAEFYAGDAGEVFSKLYSEGIRADAVILDPPRKGCDNQLIETLLKMNPEKIVYVSCNPATLARDAKILCEHGYSLSPLYPFDCFPQTGHVETVVLLSKLKSSYA